MRPTEHVRRVLRRAQVGLGLLAVAVAVPVGVAVTAQHQPAPVPDMVTVSAELLQASPAPEIATVHGAVPTSARWTTPAGAPRVGLVWADAGLPHGDLVTVEVDAAGGAVDVPPAAEAPWLTGLLAAIATILSCWALLVGTTMFLHSRLAALDAAQWSRDWAQVEPIWSGRAGEGR